MSPKQHERQCDNVMEMKKDEVILADIIGATDLVHPTDPKQNEKLHPFAVIKLHEKVLRCTDHEKDTNNPIWCVQHQSLFLIEGVSRKEDALLEIEVRHKDPLNQLNSKTTLLGVASIHMSTIWETCKEERLELNLMPVSASSEPSSSHNANKSKVSIRFRIATSFDLEFMEKMNKMERKDLQSTARWFGESKHSFSKLDSNDGDNETLQPPNAKLITETNERAMSSKNIRIFMNHSFRKVKKGEDGVKRMRVKPLADPRRKGETEYLSKKELETEMFKPSTNWTEVGYAGRSNSQSLGKVYLEILRCQDLPNVDVGESVGNLTDSFTCVVFEDSMVETDVIQDDLNPIWLPWTQRAFSFDITYPLSPMFISIIDHDVALSDDGIGRIAVDLNQFEIGMVYTLQYALYPASNITERKEIGKITIRIRKDIKDEKAFLLAALKPQPCFHLHMKTKKTLPVANFACFGDHNEEEYDLTLLKSYINEFTETKRFLFYAIGDSIDSLLMWRGQVQVGPLSLPLHSAIAFFGGIYIVERPHLIPGFFFLSITWIMLASMSHRMQHPSPWQRVKPLSYYLSMLLNGKSFITQPVIKKGEGYVDTIKLNANWKNRIETDVDAVWKAWELDQELEKVANEMLHTKEKKAPGDLTNVLLAPLESYLFPQQVRLRGYCDIVRRIKAVTTWEESMTSFWVAFLSMIIGVILLILPTTFLLHWVCRLLIWAFLGPWNRIHRELLDKQDSTLYMQGASAHDLKQYKLNAVTEEFEEKGRLARIKGEEAVKLKAMRVMRNGKYVSRIPAINYSRHYDYPEASMSHATMMALDKDQELPPLNYVHKQIVPSQRLEGKMIPMTIEQSEILLRKSITSPNDENETVDNRSRIGIEGKSTSITEDAGIEQSGMPSKVLNHRKPNAGCKESDTVLDNMDLGPLGFLLKG